MMFPRYQTEVRTVCQKLRTSANVENGLDAVRATCEQIEQDLTWESSIHLTICCSSLSISLPGRAS